MSQGFDPLIVPETRKAILQDIEPLSQLLYDGSQPVIDAARAHLDIK